MTTEQQTREDQTKDHPAKKGAARITMAQRIDWRPAGVDGYEWHHAASLWANWEADIIRAYDRYMAGEGAE